MPSTRSRSSIWEGRSSFTTSLRLMLGPGNPKEMSMSSTNKAGSHHGAPLVTELEVIPVAGHDSMLMNLSGAHGPFFTRNIVILKDSAGNTGVGEVPGGDKIRQTLEDARELVVGQSIGDYNRK